jgi:DNA-binding HxlR family transcriptional regulator
VAEFRYSLFCPLARAAEVLGNRWSVLILRELMVGPQRFSDLKRRLGGVSPSVLAERLSSMEKLGLVESETLPPPAASQVYRLTPRGESARSVLLEMARFGLHWLGERAADDHFEPDWLRLSLESFAVPGPTPEIGFEIEVLGAPEPLRLRFGGGADGFQFLAADDPVDAKLRATPELVLGLLAGALSPEAVCAAGATVEGDAAAIAVLPSLFEFRPDTPSARVLSVAPPSTP